MKKRTHEEIPEEAAYLLSFPPVPEKERPKNLYVNYTVGDTIIDQLAENGWIVTDVRLLPTSTMVQKADAIKATLEGARVGSLELNTQQLKFLELEARITGLLATKEVPNEKPNEKLDRGTLDQILSFGRPRAYVVAESPSPAPLEGKNKGGRPKGSKTRNPTKQPLRGGVLKSKIEALKKAGRVEDANKLLLAGGDLSVIGE